jgi:hypothetical protein
MLAVSEKRRSVYSENSIFLSRKVQELDLLEFNDGCTIHRLFKGVGLSWA